MTDRTKELMDEVAQVMCDATRNAAPDDSLSADVSGAVIGWLVGKIAKLDKRIADLEESATQKDAR